MQARRPFHEIRPTFLAADREPVGGNNRDRASYWGLPFWYWQPHQGEGDGEMKLLLRKLVCFLLRHAPEPVLETPILTITQCRRCGGRAIYETDLFGSHHGGGG